MEIVDLLNSYEVRSFRELAAILMKRHGDGANDFHLTHDGKKVPELSIMVTNELACIHYFPEDNHPGFQSVGGVANLDGEETSFTISDSGEKVDVLNSAVIPFAVALRVAQEFLADEKRPDSIEWVEL